MDTPKTHPTAEDLAQLREKYPKHNLYQLQLVDGRIVIVRGSSYDEFEQMQRAAKGRESRLAMDLVRTFTVWPEIPAQELEYNTSGDWEPGLVMALSEKIQETLGYSKEITVKKL